MKNQRLGALRGFRFSSSLLFLALPMLLAPGPALAAGPETVSARDFGAKGDGRTDDTAAFQKALDAVAKGGGIVQAGRGSFYFAGHLNVPTGVTLEGIWQSVPSHAGIRDRGHAKPTDDGTTFLVTENRGSEDKPAFITLNQNSTLKGVVLYYPDQKTDEPPAPYPYAIAMRGNNPAVLQVELSTPTTASTPPITIAISFATSPANPCAGAFMSTASSTSAGSRTSTSTPGGACTAGSSTGRWKTARPSFSGEPTGSMSSTHFVSAITSAIGSSGAGAACATATSWAWAPTTATRRSSWMPRPGFGILITNGEFVSFHGPDPTMVAVESVERRLGAVRELRVLGPVQPDRPDRRPGHGGLQRLQFHAVGRQEGRLRRAPGAKRQRRDPRL